MNKSYQFRDALYYSAASQPPQPPLTAHQAAMNLFHAAKQQIVAKCIVLH